MSASVSEAIAEPRPTTRPTAATWGALVTGVAVASLSSILTRYADGAHPLAVSFWRCAAGTVVLLPFGASKLRSFDRAGARSSIVAGVFLALHFATWISSLYLTTVASAVLLVSTTPIFVAVAARMLWKDRLSASGWLGIALAFAGSALVAGGGFGESSLAGNLLALAGGAAGAGYGLAGQTARRTVGIMEYSVVTYGVAAALLGPAAAIAGAEFEGYDSVTWWAIAALIVGPQVIGHTLVNLTLKELHVTTVTMTIMAEPIIATLLAVVLFAEAPSPLIIPAGAAILVGIYLVTRAMGRTVVVPE